MFENILTKETISFKDLEEIACICVNDVKQTFIKKL